MSLQPESPAILLLNGPNLNLLGEREPHLYGVQTLQEIEASLRTYAQKAGYSLICTQSNHEGTLIDALHQARANTQGLIINPGAYAHTSVALRDAVLAYAKPVVEVHLSNVYKRESFRHHSYLSDVVDGVICGLGAYGYEYALQYLTQQLKQK